MSSTDGQSNIKNNTLPHAIGERGSYIIMNINKTRKFKIRINGTEYVAEVEELAEDEAEKNDETEGDAKSAEVDDRSAKAPEVTGMVR